MTQKTKMEFLEKAFERKKPYKADVGIAKIGFDNLVWLWQCITTYEILDKDGSFADVDWVAETIPGREEIFELAGIVNGIENVIVLWDELEENLQ